MSRSLKYGEKRVSATFSIPVSYKEFLTVRAKELNMKVNEYVVNLLKIDKTLNTKISGTQEFEVSNANIPHN